VAINDALPFEASCDNGIVNVQFPIILFLPLLFHGAIFVVYLDLSNHFLDISCHSVWELSVPNRTYLEQA